ncbi:uncharacterized protein znf770 [Clarias gariepinus]
MTHQCTICLKQFDFVSKLRRHQLSHSGQRPFTCYICLKSFRQSSHLKGHLKSHSKLRQVSLILSQTVSSQTSYTKTEERYNKHFGVEISEEGELGDEKTWCASLQTQNQSSDGVKHLVSYNGQTCEVSQGNYDGFEDFQYSEYAKIQPGSANNNVGKQDYLKAGDAGIPEEKTVNMTHRHQCSVCLKRFSAPSKLKRHILIHSIFRPFCCEFCPKAFRQLAHLKMHLSTHFTQRRKETKEILHGNTVSQNIPIHPLDTMVYSSDSSVKQKCTEEAGDLENELKESENVHMESFPENISLNTSETTWIKSKVGHECPVCHKCFSAPSKLRRHCLTHTGQRPFQCSLCCRAFRQLSHLKAHHSVHAAPRKKLTSALQMHRVTHTQPSTSKARLRRFVHISLARKFRSAKQKLLSPAAEINLQENNSLPCAVSSSDQEINGRQDYSCSVCSKHFNAPSKLRRHILIHTGQRPFRCSLCFRGFRQKSHLKSHKCNRGSRGTFQSSTNEVHLRDPKIPDSRSNLSIRTDNEFAKGNSMSISKTGDSFVCSSRTGFAAKSIPKDSMDHTSLSYKAICRPLEEASQSKGSGYQCTVCFKIFDFPSKLSRHILIHMDIKPFKCSICSKSFRQLCHLQNHSKVHAGRKNVLCQETFKNRIGTSIPETNNHTKKSGKLPVSQRPDPYCGKQKINLFISSSHHHSENIEEFTPNIQSTSSPLKVHEGENSYSQIKRNPNQCIFCLKTFDFPSKLSRHLLVHTGIRPYECRDCCKSFKQLSHLQCHQWVHNKKHNSELGASVADHQNSIFCARTTLTDEPDLHQESSESLAMVKQGQAGYTVQVHNQEGVSLDNNNGCPSDSGHGESKVKSETDLLVDTSIYPTLKHDSDPSNADRTSNIIFYKCPNQQADKFEKEDFKVCLNTASEVADMTTRIPVRDQQEMVKTGDPGSFAQKIDRTNLNSFPFCIPEDSFQRSPAIPNSYNSRQGEGQNQHLTEPPNDLPICPSCSQCFDSLKDLNAHSCPVNCPTQRVSKAYQCAVCFKNFEAPSKLKRHYVIHTGQRPYRCNVCGKDFTQSSHLKTHMMSHR